MEKKNNRKGEGATPLDDSDDSFDYDEYVIGDDLHRIQEKEIQEGMKNAKNKMNRSVGK